MFILASKSPRRTELLRSINCDFKTVVSDADELSGDVADPKELAVANAKLKAEATAKKIGNDVPVLGADTIVALDGHIHYKPKDEADAKRILRTLAGRTHEVITGIAFVRGAEVFSAVEVTKVTFDDMTEQEIADYVATGEPMDKSGAYALQGKAGVFIKGIEGSYSNVVGLPLCALKHLARQANINLYHKQALV